MSDTKSNVGKQAVRLTDGLESTRILMIAPQPFFAVRGTPINVLQMCRALTEAGCVVDLATYPIGDAVQLPGLTVHRAMRIPWIRTVSIGFSWRKVLLDIVLSLKVFRLVLSHRYALIHAVEEAVFIALPYTYFGVRIVYDMDSLISDQLAASGMSDHPRLLAGIRRLERLALDRATAVVTVCSALSEVVRTLNQATPIFQIEDAPLQEVLRKPDTAAVEKLCERFGLGARPVLVYTGNLASYQGVQLLLDAAVILREQGIRPATVIVGGEDSELVALRSEIRSRGLESEVTAVGARPLAEMPEWMALADLLISPRLNGENTPLKIFSYMASGTPIVATDLVTHTQILDETTALLCPPTEQGMAAVIANALENPHAVAIIGRAAQRRALKDHSIAAFSRMLIAAYRSILGKSQSRGHFVERAPR